MTEVVCGSEVGGGGGAEMAEVIHGTGGRPFVICGGVAEVTPVVGKSAKAEISQLIGRPSPASNRPRYPSRLS